MASESSGSEQNSPNQMRRWIIVALALVVVVASIATGFYLLNGKKDASAPASLVSNELEADLGYGVTTVNKHPIPEGAAALASTTEGSSVRSIVVTGVGLDSQIRDLNTWGGILQSEFLPTEFSHPVAQILEAPYSRALCEILNRPCDPSQIDPATADGLAMIGIGRLWWDEDQAKWVSETQDYEANLVFGTLGDYLIGNRTNGEYAGTENTTDIPVDSITAFSIATGAPVWTLDLPRPGFVNVGPSSITVVETPVGEVEKPDFLLAEDSYMYVEQLLQASSDLQIYELVPATSENTEVVFSHPEQATPVPFDPGTESPAFDSIKNFDFSNTYFPRVYPSQGGCSPDFWYYDSEFNNGIASPFAFNKPPFAAEDADPCYWYTVSNGKSIELETVYGETMPALALTERGRLDEAAEFELSPGGELNDTWLIAYQDLNGNGYLDALIRTDEANAVAYFVAIFDPQTPDQPFISYLWGTQSETGRITEDGYIEFYDGNCASAFIGISAVPPRYTTYTIANLTQGECL
ncbi:MAG: hypothetical protein Q4P71_09905 [Actinomycetaceae bacterium]|nr:hypothetical protein [Actinomycetaceae bacterium]